MEAALRYASMGWRVIPCAVGDKPPLLAGSHGWQDGSTDRDQVARWWTDEPRANVGIVVGPESGLIVLDIDPRNGGDANLDQRVDEFGPMPTTLEVRTGGGGRHYYFQHDSRARNGVITPGVELKADSGYVLAPPSKTVGSYRWASKAAREVAPAPEWLLGLRSRTGTASISETSLILEGWRNQALTSLAGSMRARGMTVDAIRAALLVTNEQRCHPPLPEPEVQRIATSVARYRPSESSTSAIKSVNSTAIVRPKITPLASVAPRRVEWLWEGRLALGMLNCLEGDPGLGKSTVMYDIAARLSRGADMPDGTPGPAASGVVVLTAEDPLDSVVRPRLEAAGADLTRIVTLAIEDQHGEREPTIGPADLMHVEAAIRDVDAKLVIIDPLVAYLPADVNSHRDQDVRRAFAPLRALAERMRACTVFLRHLNKFVHGNPLYRGGGSIGIIGAVRSGLLMGLDPDDIEKDPTLQRRVLAPMKSNLGAAPALRLRLGVATGHENRPGAPIVVVWEGPCDHSAATLLTVPVDRGQRNEIEAAVEFLRDLLADGRTISAKEGIAAARAQGHSHRTIERARVRLRVDAYRDKIPGPWSWRLPSPRDGNGSLGGLADGEARNSLEEAAPRKTANMTEVEGHGGLGSDQAPQLVTPPSDCKTAKNATAPEVEAEAETEADILPLDRFMASALMQAHSAGGAQ
jgi:hypothetical protein